MLCAAALWKNCTVAEGLETDSYIGDIATKTQKTQV